MYFSSTQIKTINDTRAAEEDKQYIQDNGLMFFGNADGTLRSNITAAQVSFTPTVSVPQTTLQQSIESLSDETRAQNAVGKILQGTGDITLAYDASTPKITTTLTPTGVTAGEYGNATNIPKINVDAKGRILSAVNVPISVPVIVDASNTVKGITKLSVAAASPTNPIAVGDNDTRNSNARATISGLTTVLTNSNDGGASQIKNIADPTLAQDVATKYYVDNSIPTVANASETVKGIVEEATQAEVNAGTDTGGTGARLFATPSKIAVWAATIYQTVSGLSASVRAVTLTGISFATSQTIAATDTILQALGYLQAQISNLRNSGIAGATWDGAGGVITTGNYVEIAIPYAGTITNWTIDSYDIVAGTALSGSIVIDIKRSGASIIGAGNKPTLASASTNTAAVSGWTSVAVAAGDKLYAYVNSTPVSCLKVTFFLNTTKT